MRPVVNMPKEDRATDMGNVHKKFGKDCAYGSGDILADRQTHRHTHTDSSQYFAAAPVGEVKNGDVCTSVFEILERTDRQTHRLTNTHTETLVATLCSASGGKVTIGCEVLSASGFLTRSSTQKCVQF